MKKFWMVGVALCCLNLNACSDDDGSDDSNASAKELARKLGGRGSDGRDLCEEYGWYADAVCDDFCPMPDPDCGQTACNGPDPSQTCLETGCPNGQECVPSDDAGCVPSTCSCDDGNWICTADCGQPHVCAPIDSGDACGGLAGLACARNQFCDYAPGDLCGAADATGVCRDIPEACTQEIDPVCGCDDQTYSNACTANAAGVSVLSEGECGSVGGDACGGLAGLSCARNQFCDYAPGDLCGAADATGVCRDIPEACTQEIDPVCGCDDQTYSNACAANAAGVSVLSEGECGSAGGEACGGLAGLSCARNQFCDYAPGDLCGAADATGVCRDIPEACTQEFDPVCGCDDQTYSNACTANAAGVSVLSEGECGQTACNSPDPSETCLSTGCPEGEECVPSDDASCVPSACSCDDGNWICTADCGQPHVCAPIDSGDACGGLAGLSCARNQFCDYAPGDLCGAADALGVCRDIPEACTQEIDPVCGCDDQTYSNACAANAAGVSVLSEGECGSAGGEACGGFAGLSCVMNQFCDYALGDLCGAADALGVCRDIPEACTQEFDPVCGCDDQTYSNACTANAAGVSVLSEGECR